MSTVQAKFAVVFALSLLIAVSSAAGSSGSSYALVKGSQALQFGVGYDFMLSPFQGATISYERFVRDNRALRLGVQISMDYSEGPVRDDVLNEGVTGSGEADLAHWLHAYSVFCGLVSYRPGRVALYYGGGPKVTYSNRLEEDYYFRISSSGSSSSRYRNWERSWGAGLQGVIGMQWILNDRFRLLGEYATSVMYGRSFRENVSTYTDATPQSDKATDDRYFVQVTPQTVKLGLAVSF